MSVATVDPQLQRKKGMPEPSMSSPRPLRATCRCPDVAWWWVLPRDVGSPCWTCGAPLALLPIEAQR